MTLKSLLAFGIAALAVNLSVLDLQVSGAFHTVFPNTQVFSVGVAYSFANSNGQLLLPGSTGNITLIINSAVTKPVTLNLSFNASNAAIWSTPGDAVNCCPPSFLATSGALTMRTASGNVLAPINSPVNFQGQSYPFLYTVTVNTGVNNFALTINVAPTATIASVFSLSWFADQA
jgi:hypothetical protein